MIKSVPTARTELASVCTTTGARIDTQVVRMPRIILAEFNTHRIFSRNAASSRAIPFERMIAQIMDDPFVPLVWTSEKKGMQGEIITDAKAIAELERCWLGARDEAVRWAEGIAYRGAHKSICNRLLEPWMWTTVVMTACDFSNYWKLRCHPAAEHHMRLTAEAMRVAYDAAEPQLLEPGEWHLPFTSDLSPGQGVRVWMPEKAIKLSVARAASVSYKTVDGFDMTQEKANDLHDSLMASGHWSPFEHQASADRQRWSGPGGREQWVRPEEHRNLWGWRQYRAMVDA